MQPFARAAAALKAVALKAVALKAVELASSAQEASALEASALEASALEALTQGQGRLREDEVLGEETRQRLKLSDRAHGSVLLQADRRAAQIEQITLLPRVGRAPSQSRDGKHRSSGSPRASAPDPPPPARIRDPLPRTDPHPEPWAAQPKSPRVDRAAGQAAKARPQRYAGSAHR